MRGTTNLWNVCSTCTQASPIAAVSSNSDPEGRRRQAAPKWEPRTWGPPPGEPSCRAVTPSLFNTRVWWGTAGLGAHSFLRLKLIQDPSCPQPPEVLPPSSQPARQSTPKTLQLSRARGERGPRQGWHWTPRSQPRTCRVREGMRNSDRGGKTKGHKDRSCRGAQRGSWMKKGLQKGPGGAGAGRESQRQIWGYDNLGRPQPWGRAGGFARALCTGLRPVNQPLARPRSQGVPLPLSAR